MLINIYRELVRGPRGSKCPGEKESASPLSRRAVKIEKIKKIQCHLSDEGIQSDPCYYIHTFYF